MFSFKCEQQWVLLYVQCTCKVYASVFVRALHVSHRAGRFGSSPSLHLHEPYLFVLLLTLIVVAVYIAILKLYGPSKQPGLMKCAMQ